MTENDVTWRFEPDGVIRDSVLNATNDFYIYGEIKNPALMDRIACWMNGWLPRDWRLGTVDGHWRFFRI